MVSPLLFLLADAIVVVIVVVVIVAVDTVVSDSRDAADLPLRGKLVPDIFLSEMQTVSALQVFTDRGRFVLDARKVAPPPFLELSSCKFEELRDFGAPVRSAGSSI